MLRWSSSLDQASHAERFGGCAVVQRRGLTPRVRARDARVRIAMNGGGDGRGRGGGGGGGVLARIGLGRSTTRRGGSSGNYEAIPLAPCTAEMPAAVLPGTALPAASAATVSLARRPAVSAKYKISVCRPLVVAL